LFNEEDHVYTLNGNTLPSVTQILEHVGIVDKRFYTPGSAEKGREIHSLCQIMDGGGDWWDYTEWADYAYSYQQFLNDYEPEWIMVEEALHHDILGYAGTVDRFGILKDEKAVVDIKSGKPNKWHELQLIAYASMIDRDTDKMPKLYGLYLNYYPDKETTYRLKEYGYNAANLWAMAVQVAQYGGCKPK